MGLIVYNPSASFVRPNNTTAYASGQLVANSTTAGSVVAMQFAPGMEPQQSSLSLKRIRMFKTSTGITGTSFRLHLYQSTAPTCANGDGGNWSTNQALNYMAFIDVTMDKQFTDGAGGMGALAAGSEANLRVASGGVLFGLIEARGAYTPTANETFTTICEFVESY